MADFVPGPEGAPPLPPVLAFRVGITGTRDLDAEALPHLDSQVRAVLGLIRQELERMAAEPWFAVAYGGSTAVPFLRLLSPLARGADRLAARIALAEGYRLHVPMPFPQPVYEQDFVTAEDLAEFRALRQQAGGQWLALDGDPDTGRDSAYEAAGRTVVRNCDLLLAIWDGNTGGNGRGGTADIVRYAAASGVPTWWMHTGQPAAPVWLADLQDIRDPRPGAEPAERSLRTYLRGLVPPPAPPPRRHHGVTSRLAYAGRDKAASPLVAYFRPGGRAAMPVGRAHGVFMDLMAGRPGRVHPAGHRAAPPVPADPVAAFWFARFRTADRLAIRIADQYRSGYVWTFLFGTMSVILGACSLLVPQPVWFDVFAGGELVMLVLILVLVSLGIGQDWHEHSIEFRLLAELYRKQQALGPLGWTLPIIEVRGLADTGDAAPDRGAWVGWLFAAEQRRAPLPTGSLADTAQGPVRRAILDDLIAEQRAYHRARALRDGHASHRLGIIGEAFFFVVLALVAAKLLGARLIEGTVWASLAGLLVTVLPAVSAAFVGIRAYSEVPVLAVQSRHMEAVLKAAHERVERLGLARPLVSQDLGAEAASVATIMLQDLDGWARLFRVKSLEAGG